MKTIIFYILILFILVSCSGRFGLAMKEKIITNYYLIAADDIKDCGLSYHENTDGSNYGLIITATVYAVGYNDKYMIIKQHPRSFPKPPDKKITNYYILPLKKGMNWRTNNGLIGPLTFSQFNEQRKKLGIEESLSFTKVIHELE